MNGSSNAFTIFPAFDGLHGSSQNHRPAPVNRNGHMGYGIPSYFAARRHRRVLRDNLRAAMTKPAIRRLARRGGIRRIQKDIYPTVQEVVRDRLKLIIQYASELVVLAGRKTMTALDVVYALRSIGSPLYGFGMIEKGSEITDHAAIYRAKKRKQAAEVERVSRLNMVRAATQAEAIDRTRSTEGLSRDRPRELQNRRVDEFMKQMKRGARC